MAYFTFLLKSHCQNCCIQNFVLENRPKLKIALKIEFHYSMITRNDLISKENEITFRTTQYYYLNSKIENTEVNPHKTLFLPLSLK